MHKKETVGKQALDLIQGSTELEHSATEQMREQLEDYEKNILETLESGKNTYNGDFYIVVETKKEPKLKNVIRNYFFHRISCPTPTYDNVVYKYHKLTEELEFLWVLPSRDTYFMMKERALEIPKEERELLEFVLADADGTLLKKCKMMNLEVK